MDVAVTCDQFLSIDRQGIPTEIRQSPSGFLYDHRSCGHIPWAKPHFPESVKAACCDIAEVQRSRSCSSQALCFEGEFRKVIKIISGSFSNVIGKSGDKQAVVQDGGARNVERMAVQIGAPVLDGSEKLVSRWVEDDAEDTAPMEFQPDRHAIGRIAVGKICGAVERVNDPEVG